MLLFSFLLVVAIFRVEAYTRLYFSVYNDSDTEPCSPKVRPDILRGAFAISGHILRPTRASVLQCSNTDKPKVPSELPVNSELRALIATSKLKDPYFEIRERLHKELYGEKVAKNIDDLRGRSFLFLLKILLCCTYEFFTLRRRYVVLKDLLIVILQSDSSHWQLSSSAPAQDRHGLMLVASTKQNVQIPDEEEEVSNHSAYHYPDGQVKRSEVFNNRSGVHFPPTEFIHRGFALLNITSDHMQTAINAFTILLLGNIEDVQRLPPEYVLKSARTIAMMKMTREKFTMLWTVLKGDRRPTDITYEELEMYRPLFKYVNAREIARLNLNDTRIINFIGTHADLDRHQVGVVASKYMTQNPEWSKVKFLNHMNNLLCGVPMNFMRKIPSEIYLQLSHQVFYHIRACDPLQRRFYLAMMMKTEALGKSYSWSARDVSRLGLLLAEVQGPDLAAINPESMSGITAQVMMEIPAYNLEYFTEIQVEYLGLKPLTIFARKIKMFYEYIDNEDNGAHIYIINLSTIFSITILINKIL